MPHCALDSRPCPPMPCSLKPLAPCACLTSAATSQVGFIQAHPVFPNCTGNHGIALVHPTVLEPARMRCRSTDARHQLLCDGQTARHILPSLSLLTATLQCLQVHAMRRQSPALLRVPVLLRKSSRSALPKDQKDVPMWTQSHLQQCAWQLNCSCQAVARICKRAVSAGAPLNTFAVTRAPTCSTRTGREQRSCSQAPAAGAYSR